MKIGKVGCVVLAAGVLGIAFASLGMTRSQQSAELNRLGRDLAVSTLKLEKLQLDPLYAKQNELQTRLKRTQVQLEAAKAVIREDIDSLYFTDLLFYLAGTDNVTLEEVSSPAISNGSLKTVPCTILPFRVTVAGRMTDLVRFVKDLSINFDTGVIQEVGLSSNNNSISASVQMKVYSYRGN